MTLIYKNLRARAVVHPKIKAAVAHFLTLPVRTATANLPNMRSLILSFSIPYILMIGWGIVLWKVRNEWYFSGTYDIPVSSTITLAGVDCIVAATRIACLRENFSSSTPVRLYFSAVASVSLSSACFGLMILDLQPSETPEVNIAWVHEKFYEC